ncbi:hypothetical protein C2845_PM03G03870 [Panicum miliaceum]|uniref:Uncharacterized protein n=1 Tax=Panicum miliaceum TaxID=4540 RepID=A0A3L6TGN3_PANMI|nr:hypothetical protein C2845_PM03G03870 [Panicum miliaceum]
MYWRSAYCHCHVDARYTTRCHCHVSTEQQGDYLIGRRADVCVPAAQLSLGARRRGEERKQESEESLLVHLAFGVVL